MNEFDRRWQECAAEARKHPPSPMEAPLGFATRVLARRGGAGVGAGDAVSVLWQRLGWRAFAVVASVMMIFAVLEYRDRSAAGLGFPHVERTVATALWLL